MVVQTRVWITWLSDHHSAQRWILSPFQIFFQISKPLRNVFPFCNKLPVTVFRFFRKAVFVIEKAYFITHFMQLISYYYLIRWSVQLPAQKFHCCIFENTASFFRRAVKDAAGGVQVSSSAVDFTH